MEHENVPYQSYCWCLGTTSYRTRNFNQNIEWQLDLLDEFWQDHDREPWGNNRGLQSEYYRFLQARGFLQGQAPRPDKDAREKTSGLVDIGLLDQHRRLTGAGRSLLALSRAGDFAPDNPLDLPKDSFLYLKQLLKTGNTVDGGTVRPYLVLVYLLERLDYLTDDEFTYLLPLCVNRGVTEELVERIAALRAQGGGVDSVLLETVMERANYARAYREFMDNPVTEDLLCAVGMNRKSRGYDRAYYPLYQALRAVVVEGDEGRLRAVFDAARGLNLSKYWKPALFGTHTSAAIRRDPAGCFRREVPWGEDETAFKELFFLRMHLFKCKATLSDYKDLNRRYFRLTDTVLFEDGTVKLDVAPRQFFGMAMEGLWPEAFRPCGLLEADVPLEDISPSLAVDEGALAAAISAALGLPVANMAQARQAVRDERHRRFDRLIDARFSDGVLMTLLDQFRDRDDEALQNAVTDNADVPTLFEYVLGILWYKLSGRQGNILDYMNLSLEADLLPRTHAGGGEADIVYQYDQPTAAYGPHTLLLEATLVDDTGQRRMEEEPVTRHLGRYLLDHPDREAYCVFVAPYLDINVLSAFRAKKRTRWYDTANWDHWIPGMKVLPLSTDDLKRVLSSGRTYEGLYQIFAAAHASEEEDVPSWYRQLQQSLEAPGPQA